LNHASLYEKKDAMEPVTSVVDIPGGVGIGMTKVLHVKIPVTDLEHSADWYVRLMDLELAREFIEDGQLRGVALYSPEGRSSFALRMREHCPGQPVLEGFDVVALHMATREHLVRLRERCARLGITCSAVQDRSDGEAVVDVADPDGTVLRFYWVGQSDRPDHFVGIVFDHGQVTRLTSTPQLDLPLVASRSWPPPP
jgi:catechol 2,3-dioxygenase-like lactoylglutathione lyase family enzyme